MTSEAKSGGKIDHRRRERRNQLQEAGSSALAAGLPHLPPICRPRKAKAKRRTITGIATACARA